MKKLVLILLILIALVAAYNVYPTEKLPVGATIDKLTVNKSKRELVAWSGNRAIKTYKVALGHQPVAHKEYEGDGQTPEGLYYIQAKSNISGYHKNLGISYPNPADIAHSKILGHPPGGDIKIHGLQNGLGFIGKLHRLQDWTAGCIALTNDEVDELYDHVAIGTPIEIRP